jgi:hypothetical protein
LKVVVEGQVLHAHLHAGVGAIFTGNRSELGGTAHGKKVGFAGAFANAEV